jgi:hypothetical protein
MPNPGFQDVPSTSVQGVVMNGGPSVNAAINEWQTSGDPAQQARGRQVLAAMKGETFSFTPPDPHAVTRTVFDDNTDNLIYSLQAEGTPLAVNAAQQLMLNRANWK